MSLVRFVLAVPLVVIAVLGCHPGERPPECTPQIPCVPDACGRPGQCMEGTCVWSALGCDASTDASESDTD